MTTQTTPYLAALADLLAVQTSPKLGLARMRALLTALGDPQEAQPCIHIAGTKGKGSTCAFVDSLLDAAGVSRMLTTSPHLTSARERIRINGELIDEVTFTTLAGEVSRAAATLDEPATFFERITAMALLGAARAHVDVAVLEVGLGGRLDATNVVTPVACGVTRLGLDHQQYLGDTLALIAGEKAGIFKPGVPAFTVPQEADARSVLLDTAERVGAPLSFVAPLAAGVPLGLMGAHQRENAALALALVEAAGVALDDAQRARGLMRASWPGRYEVLRESPLTLIDGAHNAMSARALRAALDADARLAGKPLLLVVGMTTGHDPTAFAHALEPRGVMSTLAVRARAPRSEEASVVAAAFEAAGFGTVTTAELTAGLDAVLERAQSRGAVVVVTGSLYLVGEVRARFVAAPIDPALPLF